MTIYTVSNVQTTIKTPNNAGNLISYNLSTYMSEYGGYGTGSRLTILDSGYLKAEPKDGYTFDGWYTTASNASSSSQMEMADATVKIGSSATINASEISAAAKKYSTYYIVYPKYIPDYTVTLNTNGGTINAGNVTSYTGGTGATLPTDVTRSGYTFGGWYSSASFTGSAVTAISASDSGNKVYYAKWNPISYDITLNVNGGTINAGNVTGYETGETTTLPENVTKTGYVFGGWYTTPEMNGPRFYQIGSWEYGNKTFYAKWNRQSYSITLNKNGGTINSGNVTSYYYGTGATLPTNVTKSGHVFGGWYENAALTGSAVTAISASATGAKTFYAKWTAAHTVTFVDHDGTVLKTEQVLDGDDATPPSEPVRDGYDFVDWSGSYTSVTDDETVTATWSVKTYTVRFLDVDGTVLKTQTVTHGSAATPPTDPSREGYTFVGWSVPTDDVRASLDVYAMYDGAANYRCRGRRWQRLYVAETATPCYEAKHDAELIARTLCDVPWTETDANYRPCFPVHAGNDDSDIENVAKRKYFDAAMFCAEHALSMHRAYAQATCYKLALPASAIGKKMTTLSVNVNGDPYLRDGARIAVLTNSTGEIPTDCATCRTGAAYKSGAAARTTNADGTRWYSASERVTLTPEGGLTLGSYLYVIVALENYAHSRSEYLEGAAYIEPDIEIGMAQSVSGWSESGVNECYASYREYNVCRGGILPKAPSGVSSAVMVYVTGAGDAEGVNPGTVTKEQSCIGLRTAYASFYRGIFSDVQLPSDGARFGAGFSVRYINSGGGTNYGMWRISAAALAVPFAAPVLFKAQKIRLDWSDWNITATPGSKFHVWIDRGHYEHSVSNAILMEPHFWDGLGRAGDHLKLVGTVDARLATKTCTFDLGTPLDDYVATVYLSAFLSLDDFNPEDGMDGTKGTSTAFNLSGSSVAGGWKPDITLIG